MKLPDGWKEVKLGDIAKISSGSTPARNKSSYWNGNIPWVKTTQIQNCHITKDSIDEYITQEGFENSSLTMIPKGTILMAMYGQGRTRGQLGILDIDATTNQACAAIKNDKTTDTDFLYQLLLYHYEDIRNLSNVGGQQNLSGEIIRTIDLKMPPLPEQKAIADTLSVWDCMIEKTEKLIDEKEKNYSCFMEKVFSVKGKKEQVLVKKFAQEVSVRNSSLSVTQVLSVTNKNGFVLPEEQFSKHVASNDLSNYKVVKKRQFAYNPSRINVGSIARLDNWDNAVLSPMYTVFEIKEGMVNSDYFFHWLHSHRANQKIKTCAQGGVRAIVNFSDFASISLYVPEKRKQDEIADVLNSMQKEITLLRQLAEQYKLQKQGLMQKLLTGQWRME
ncbi:MAG TPA: restriction endonuclease subunit S [Treponema sp.]|nr:restriction endonuclease subunit S [Treponema sp.]